MGRKHRLFLKTRKYFPCLAEIVAKDERSATLLTDCTFYCLNFKPSAMLTCCAIHKKLLMMGNGMHVMVSQTFPLIAPFRFREMIALDDPDPYSFGNSELQQMFF